MLKREILLLDMLKKEIQNIRFTFKNQKVIQNKNKFYFLMTELDNDGYINKVRASSNVRYYTLSDKGYLQACLKTSDLDCLTTYHNMITGFIHFTIED